MSDILIPVNTDSVKLFVREVDGSVKEVSSHSERLTATKAANRLNFARGMRTGDFYFVEGDLN